MHTKKIVTNLRIDQHEWIQFKIMASELNMSVNEYVTYLLKNLSARRVLEKKYKKEKHLPVWELGAIAKKVHTQSLSEEDEIIYG